MKRYLALIILLLNMLLSVFSAPAYADSPGHKWTEDTLTWNTAGANDPVSEVAAWNRVSSDPVGFMLEVRTAADFRRQIDVRNSYSSTASLPSSPQPYWKIFVPDDFSFLVLCEYDDGTGIKLFCDEYV